MEPGYGQNNNESFTEFTLLLTTKERTGVLIGYYCISFVMPKYLGQGTAENILAYSLK